MWVHTSHEIQVDVVVNKLQGICKDCKDVSHAFAVGQIYRLEES